jgi:general secretion pathway protein M
MQWLPKQDHSPALAIGLAVLALVLVYLVGFHWFVVRHADISRERAQLEQQAARFKGALASEPALRQQLDALRGSDDAQQLFLAERNFNTAAARMTRRLRDVVRAESQHDGFCQVNATENRADDGESEQFEKVTVNVRMTCPLDDFTRIVYALKANTPLLFIDDVVIQQRMTVARRGGSMGNADGQLEIRFDMYGYRNQLVDTDDA